MLYQLQKCVCISVTEKSIVCRLVFFLQGGRYKYWYCDHKLHHGGLSSVWLTDLRVVSLKWLTFWNIYQQANNYICRHLNNKHRSNFIFDEAKTTKFIFVELFDLQHPCFEENQTPKIIPLNFSYWKKMF